MKLINEFLKNEFLREEECEYEMSFKPFADKETGEIVGVLQVEKCLHCDEEYVAQVFTDGSLRAEMVALELGFRGDEDDWDDDCED